MAVQRMLVFLGYSTAASGAFLIDGDFGRGTNRGIAQFQFEHGLTNKIKRNILCYPCTFQTARRLINSIPDARLDMPTIERMLEVVIQSIEAGDVTFGDFDEALFHLNSLHQVRHFNCRQILEHYGAAVDKATQTLKAERDVEIQPEWILSIIRQETAGVVRPRFEQHKLSQFNKNKPRMDFAEMRYQSMSIGLGQIMGFNHKKVGAPSARSMLFSPIDDQVLYVTRFIASKTDVIKKTNPRMSDFRAIARYYNGPAYETHHYHEGLQSRFREFRRLRGS